MLSDDFPQLWESHVFFNAAVRLNRSEFTLSTYFVEEVFVALRQVV